jgi:periplasmic divalent cation tolerance protein
MPAFEPPDCLVGGLVEIRTTFGSRDAALACAARLVRDRLAGCVQVDGPVISTYAWQGAIERADEWRCTCKTTSAAREACVAVILADHPYDTPQIVVVPVEASAAYAKWVHETVSTKPPEGL